MKTHISASNFLLWHWPKQDSFDLSNFTKYCEFDSINGTYDCSCIKHYKKMQTDMIFFLMHGNIVTDET